MASILNVILRVTGQSSLGGTFTGLNQGLQLAQAGVQALNDTVGEFIRQGVQMNSFLETSEIQFKTLMGSAGAAHDQVQMLFDLAAHTPFTFESVTKASRELEVFGGAALDTRENLTLLGDAAAATGADITQVTFWTGRLYSELQAGKPIGESARWLQQMGVMSAEARNKLEELQKSGASGNDIWAAYTQSLQRFGGAMKEQEGTWQGLTSTMQDTFTLLEGTATKGLFTNLEKQIRGVNDALSSAQAQQGAEQMSETLGVISDVGAKTAGTLVLLGGTIIEHTPNVILLAQAYRELSDAINGVPDKPPPTTTSDAILAGVAAQRQYADATKEASGAMRDESERINEITATLGAYTNAQERANDALRNAKEQGDGSRRTIDSLAGSYSTLTEAEKQRLYDEGQALANAGSQEEIIFNARAKMAANVAEAEKRNAAQAAENEKAAFQEAADAIRQKNQETADAIREAQQASQEAVRRAYVETADEAERAFERVRDAAAPPVDTLSQQLNEAVNRQVREGIAGTADAEKQLDDIRRQHLATLPDLVALDQQYAAAQSEVRTADVALAAAQRNLAVAMAASGGQQTLQTAALQHAVTAAQDADQAARAHAAALGQEQSQAVSDTNALRGLAAQRASMGGGGGNSLLLPDTGSQARRTTIYGMPFIQPTIVTNHITNNGPVGVDDLGRQITDTVNAGMRNGSVRVPGLATR